jgi:hypothetical protein
LTANIALFARFNLAPKWVKEFFIMTALEGLALVLVGAFIALFALLLGAALTFALMQNRHAASANRMPKRKRKPRHAAALVPTPAVPPPAVPDSSTVPAGAESSAAGAVAAQPESLPPLPLEPPALDEVGEKAVKLHQYALGLWNLGNHAKAYEALQQAMNQALSLRNPWLQIEIWAEMRQVLVAMRVFGQGAAIEQHIERLRSTLPQGAQPESTYLKGEKFEDALFVFQSHSEDVQKCHEAYALYSSTESMLNPEQLEQCENIAREALEKAEAQVGPNHWIVGVMLHGVARVLFVKGDLAGARAIWHNAQIILSDWMYAVPELQQMIAHNLRELSRAMDEGA